MSVEDSGSDRESLSSQLSDGFHDSNAEEFAAEAGLGDYSLLQETASPPSFSPAKFYSGSIFRDEDAAGEGVFRADVDGWGDEWDRDQEGGMSVEKFCDNVDEEVSNM